MNDVIRSVYYSAMNYKVKRVIGFKYGWLGLSKKGRCHVDLNYEMVNKIHLMGGTFLASSRDRIDISEMLDTLLELNISVLIAIGGDGTHNGAFELYKKI